MSADQNKSAIERLGAVVLCGGKSSRLGVDKSQLVFQEQTFLERVVGCVSDSCSTVVLVGDVDLSRHELPNGIINLNDEHIGNGPLEGIRVGLKCLADQMIEFGFVTSCDVPLLNADLIRFLLDQIDDQQAVVPVEANRVFGMTAIYRTELHWEIGKRIDRKQLRVSDLANTFDVNRIDVELLRSVDSDLNSLANINTGDEYLDLLERFGLECPAEFASKFVRSRD